MTADQWGGRCNGCGHEIARVGCQCPKPGGAELLRRAAALMRERAEAVTVEHYVEQTLLRGVIRCTCGASSVGDPDWAKTHVAELSWQQSSDDATQVWDDRERLVTSAEGSDEAAYIASWHPAVALAVADWLDYAAETAAGWERIGVHDPGGWPEPTRRAVLIAAAYLGESS